MFCLVLFWGALDLLFFQLGTSTSPSTLVHCGYWLWNGAKCCKISNGGK